MTTENRHIAAKLALLETREAQIVKLSHEGMRAEWGPLFQLDLVALAAAKRAVALSAGFREMISIENLACAGALLRVHLDTALRIQAFTLVEDPEEVADQFRKGAKIRDIKDREGNLMTDKYLIGQVTRDGPEFAWVKRVYEETSGYVHFSKKHLFGIFGQADRATSSVVIDVSPRDAEFRADVYLEAIDAMLASTSLFMDYHRGWKIARTGESVPGAWGAEDDE